MNTTSHIYALGPEGTSGHEVALNIQQYYGYGTIVLLNSHAEVFEKTAKEDRSCGVVRIGNSVGGLVEDVIDYWRSNKQTPLQVIREISKPVRHHILMRESADIDSVRKIFSHPQALAQCKRTLARYRFEISNVSSNALGAKIVLRSKKDVGALGSDFLASCSGLCVAISNVHDFQSNVTKFHIISKSERAHDGEGRTAVLFRIGNGVGSLVDFLNLFKEVGVNIASLHSLPIWNDKEMVFYCEFDSYASGLPIYSRIQNITKRYRMLGSYDRHLIE